MMRKIKLSVAFVCCGVAMSSLAALAQATKSAAAVAQQKSPPAIQTQTRLITVDVVATDSHGKPIRGLTQNDFQVIEEHAGPQKIAKFRFVDASTKPPVSSVPPAAPGAHVYTNQTFDKLTVPPSVLLMDALNTDSDHQLEVHRHMLTLLKTLPTGTPIAVFALGHNLRVVQNFTTDPKLLRAAVDRTIQSNGTDIEQDPQDDPNSSSNFALDANGGDETSEIQSLENFEATTYEAQMAIRVDETTDAMLAISKYLSGYPGRKNLLWFSEAFPGWIEPRSDFGTDVFNGTADYSAKIRQSFEALTDAQVSVYPVDARGLDTSQLFSADQNTQVNQANPRSFGSQLGREDDRRYAAQGTMEEIAERTGGKMCQNTNDLAGCVQSALDDSSAYYELAYYPSNSRWDGNFHKITVKSTDRGTKLRYRTGYFATDPATLAKSQTPTKLLQQACAGPLPATSIPVSVVPLQSVQQPGQPAQNRYLLTISSAAVTLPTADAARESHLQMAVCEYTAKGDSFVFFPRDLSRSVPDAVLADWQANGVRNIFDYDAKPESQRLRFAVLDVPSGQTGSVDVPAHPAEFTPAPAKSAAAPPVRIPFKNASGASSALDWSGGTVTYHGDIGVASGAFAFFKAAYGSRYQCDAGKLSAVNPALDPRPSFSLVFHSPDGRAAFVELGGDAPVYAGDMPVDASAKAFFDYLWKLSHCQQP